MQAARPHSATSGFLRDVWDGTALHPLCEPGRFFSDKRNLALALSTDGVPLYKSSPVSLWPVYLVILNLPAQVRMRAQNIILCAVWVGPTKPIIKLLLDPICEYLKNLSTLGAKFGNCTYRAKLVMGVFDLPAKAAVLCAKQFNGEYGCAVCIHPGKRLPNNSRIYLPDSHAERTHRDILTAASEAERDNSCVQGIYSTSPFASTLDMVASFPVDYMHCVLEGVTRMLMRAWFDSKNHTAPYYIGCHVKEIDTRLLKQRPPNEFSRPPRSIKKHFKYWKAAELRYWLLYYSLPLLLNVLPSLYWHHYSLLVCAMHILLGDRISNAQINAAEQMLKDFYALLPDLYGEKSCTHNAHLLSHITKYVRLWGPLWTHSAFGYESKNGQLKHFFHGKSEIHHQLIFNIDVSYTLQYIHKQLLQCESERVLHYLNQSSQLIARHDMISLGLHSYAIGQCKMAKPTQEQSVTLGNTENIKIFSRLFKDGIIYYSKNYQSQGGKRDNIHCQYQNESGEHCFGEIEVFTMTPIPSAFIRQLKPTSPSLVNRAGNPCRNSLMKYQSVDLLGSYIVPVKLCNSILYTITIDSIIAKVCIISELNNLYCVVQPNNTERH